MLVVVSLRVYFYNKGMCVNIYLKEVYICTCKDIHSQVFKFLIFVQTNIFSGKRQNNLNKHKISH